MIVTLHSADLMACAFPYSPLDVAKIKGLPGRRWDGDAKHWLLPVSSFEQLIAAFSDAQVAPEVWEAAYPPTPSDDEVLAECLAWCKRLMWSGVTFHADGDRIVIRHPAASAKDLARLQPYVNERADAIRRLVAAGHQLDVLPNVHHDVSDRPAVMKQPLRKPKAAPIGPMREPTPMEQALATGMHNAQINAEREQAAASQRRLRKAEANWMQKAMFARGGGNGRA